MGNEKWSKILVAEAAEVILATIAGGVVMTLVEGGMSFTAALALVTALAITSFILLFFLLLSESTPSWKLLAAITLMVIVSIALFFFLKLVFEFVFSWSNDTCEIAWCISVVVLLLCIIIPSIMRDLGARK